MATKGKISPENRGDVTASVALFLVATLFLVAIQTVAGFSWWLTLMAVCFSGIAAVLLGVLAEDRAP